VPDRFDDYFAELEADRREQQDRLDRQREQGSHPQSWLGALNACAECGCVPAEISPGHWACACLLPIGTATTNEE
jgi:hypothetical protein